MVVSIEEETASAAAVCSIGSLFPESDSISIAASVIQSIIEHGAFPCLLNLLTHNHKWSIKKEACWTISNITAGNKEQIQVTNIEFVFNLDGDMTLSIAGEMVEQLELPKEDVTLIAELMDNVIIKMVPCWMPSSVRFSGVKFSYGDPILVS
ncbi:hypothetical protein ACSBR2_009093 [Camellia fascicularis]